VICTEAFLIFRSAWVLALALVVHGAGWLACLKEPRIFDLWLVRVSLPAGAQLQVLAMQLLSGLKRETGADLSRAR
jgi:hypothetical protein